MELYEPGGWLNMPEIIKEGYPFIWTWGGRGIGKTYGALKYAVYTNPIEFIYMRRTQMQLDLCSRQETSPFAKLDSDLHTLTAIAPITKQLYGIYTGDLSDNKIKPTGSPLGVGIALSTVHNIRGFSSNAKIMIYDEYIPERHERPIKNEYEAFANAYETINRNRELNGEAPLQVVALTNSNDLGNPYFLELDIIRQAEKMMIEGIEVWTDDKRGLMLVAPQRSPISAAKRKTALYRLNGDNDFSKMALNNEFSAEEKSTIRVVPLSECIPLFTVGKITIYRHKTQNYIYVSTKRAGSPISYTDKDTDLRRCLCANMWVWDCYMSDSIIFSEYLAEIYFRKYFA